VVAPSRYEGQNIVVLEGAALGKAVLVSDIKELHYAVESGFAVAFRSNSRGDLRRCILELWNRENLRHQLEHCARPGVKDLTWENQAERFEKYCRQVVAACKGES
jgi:glycosyltransferase involved in cell wall biosynthesis